MFFKFPVKMAQIIIAALKGYIAYFTISIAEKFAAFEDSVRV